jgi:flavin-dependent dehydrogenase
MTIAPRTALSVANVEWDAMVIGAGPAGSLAARQLALAGLRTLLVDAKSFPRQKVCGGCLNHRAVDALDQSGLTHILENCGARPIDAIRLKSADRTATFPLPAGLAIARDAFDQALAIEAARAGAIFAPGTQAVVEPKTRNGLRWVSLARAGRRQLVCARVVVCADGLSRSSVKRLPECAARVARRHRIGVGAALVGDGAEWPDRYITMAVSRHGYVGMARAGEKRLNVAAALDSSLLAEVPTGQAIERLLADAGVAAPAGLVSANWFGTPPLTSRPGRVAAERLFLIGDAAGYVEPFTGDGMAAALESAMAVTPLVLEAASQWRPALQRQWLAEHYRLVHRRQATCRRLAWIVRKPWAVSASLRLCSAYPRVAARWIAKVG